MSPHAGPKLARQVTAPLAASFLAHELPRDQPLDSVVPEFAAWWLERAEAERLDPSDVDFAADLLGARLGPEASAALLSELLESLPFDLLWKAAVLLRTAASSPFLLEALRQLVMSEPFDARGHVAEWLLERGALGVAELSRLLEDPNVRDCAARTLEKCAATDLRPLGAALAHWATIEKNKSTRRTLALLARRARGRQKANASEPLDAAAVATRIQVDWDAGGARARSRRHLARLAEMANGAGLVQLLTLQQRASSPSLRKACRALLDSRLDAVDLGDALTAEIERVPVGPARKPIEQLVATHLQQAMIAERPLDSRRLVALLAALGPRRALLVRSAPDGGLWFLRADSSPLPAHVWVVHPASVAPDALHELTTQAAREKLVVPCDQLTRAVFRLAAHQQSEQRLELDVPSARVPDRLLVNGWRPVDCESLGDEHDADYGSFSESAKLFAGAHVEARWTHTTMFPNAPEQIEPDNDEWLTFWSMSQPPLPLQLGQVSPIVFSEVVRELTPKSARSYEQTKPASRRGRTKKAPASNSACTEEICALASRLASSPERRADALRLVPTLDQRAQDLIQVFTLGKARSDDEACALLDLTPRELGELTELILRTFAPVLEL